MSYPPRHLDPDNAAAYRRKFDRTVLRRLSNRRERGLVLAAAREAIELLPDVLPSEDSPSLLDFPCGAGRLATLLRPLVTTYKGADHSPYMLAICEHELAGAGLRDGDVSFERGDARAMPFADGSFDLACCIRLIHHFQDGTDRARILSEFRRVTRTALVLTFLDAESPKQWIHARKLALAKRHSRRALLSRTELAAEAGAAGWRLHHVRALSGLFSGQSVATLVAG